MRVILLLLLLFCGVVSAQSIKVMSYNIRFDNPGDGVNQWSNRKEKVYQLINKYDPDIVGIQEALLHQLEGIQKNTSGAFEISGVGRDDGKQKGEFSAILYKKDKYELIEENTFWLSKTPEVPGSKSWDAAITRVASWAKLRDKQTGKTFLFVNTHFDHIGKEARENSAVLLKEKIAALHDNMPVIVSGDINCTRDQAPYKIMIDPSTVKLIDPAPEKSHGTFCNFGVDSMPCQAIDYIFHTPEWSASSYTVVTDHDGKYYPSDHLPVMVSLSLR